MNILTCACVRAHTHMHAHTHTHTHTCVVSEIKTTRNQKCKHVLFMWCNQPFFAYSGRESNEWLRQVRGRHDYMQNYTNRHRWPYEWPGSHSLRVNGTDLQEKGVISVESHNQVEGTWWKTALRLGTMKQGPPWTFCNLSYFSVTFCAIQNVSRLEICQTIFQLELHQTTFFAILNVGL
jgi:hypothetical protein